MRPIFIMVKCELGHAYDTAEHAVDEIEEVSEIYSISGQFDLMVKCYLPEDMDVGRFVNSRIHALPHIKDTMTLITFNAFAGKG